MTQRAQSETIRRRFDLQLIRLRIVNEEAQAVLATRTAKNVYRSEDGYRAKRRNRC